MASVAKNKLAKASLKSSTVQGHTGTTAALTTVSRSGGRNANQESLGVPRAKGQ